MRIFVVEEDLGQVPRDVADMAEAQALADSGHEVFVPLDRDGDGVADADTDGDGDIDADDLYVKLEPTQVA